VLLFIGIATVAHGALAIDGYRKMRALSRSRSCDPADTDMSIALARPGQRPGTVNVEFVNAGLSPVLVCLFVRMRFGPAGWQAQRTAGITFRTRRGRYRALAQAAIAVVPANGTASIPIWVYPHWQRRIVAVIGESDGRRRTISLPIPKRSPQKACRRANTVGDGGGDLPHDPLP
jgi:hypothetical protein